MRLSKIYTKTGDSGTTSLASGERLAKNHIRIESYGTVDELNSFVGLWSDTLNQINLKNDLQEKIFKIQNELFDVGGELATPEKFLDISRQQVVTLESITRLEDEIDEWNKTLPPLANFVLPGGHSLNSLAHVCRTICRRAERHLVTLANSESIRPELIVYLNRLSDWFFVASRHVSQILSIPEVIWQQNKKRP